MIYHYELLRTLVSDRQHRLEREAALWRFARQARRLEAELSETNATPTKLRIDTSDRVLGRQAA